MPQSPISQVLVGLLRRILSPLIKVLLRYGMSYAAFDEIAKSLFVEVAKAEFAIPGKKQTTSRISTITGLSRKEVVKIEESATNEFPGDTISVNRAARVISGWVRDASYHNGSGQPLALPFDGEAPSFSQLVKHYSGDITARTIADELTRVGAIQVSNNGLLHLNQNAYIPKEDEVAKLVILGTDVADLILSIDHNLRGGKDDPYFQRKVAYNYLPLEALPTLKAQLAQHAQQCLEKLDKTLAGVQQKPSETSINNTFARAGIGIYYFQSEHNQ